MNVPTNTSQPSEDTVAARVATLRDTLGMTQQQVADKSDGRLKRTEVVKVESGYNQGTSDKVRAGLASAFGVSRELMADYLDGKVDLPRLLEFRRAPGLASTSVELQDRYSNRTAAAIFAEASGIDKVAIQITLSAEYKSDQDFTAQEWLDLIKAEAAKLKHRVKDPQATARERKADLDGQVLIDKETEESEARSKAARERRKKMQSGG